MSFNDIFVVGDFLIAFIYKNRSIHSLLKNWSTMKNLFTFLFILSAIVAFGQNSKPIALLEIKPKIEKQTLDRNYIGEFDEKNCPCEKSIAKYRDRNKESWSVYLNWKTEIIFYVKDDGMFKIEY